MKEITLIIADDHPLFRQGVVDALSLEKDFRIMAQASDGKEAIDQIRALNPMVAIVDINMPVMNGQQVSHQVTSEHLSTRVVLLTGYDDIGHIREVGHCFYSRNIMRQLKYNKPAFKRVNTRIFYLERSA